MTQSVQIRHKLTLQSGLDDLHRPHHVQPQMAVSRYHSMQENEPVKHPYEDEIKSVQPMSMIK